MPHDLLIKGFDALQFVTNPYALYGFVFLAGTVAIGLLVKNQRTKAILLVVFAVLALGATYNLIDTTLTGIKKQLLVHLVRDKNRPLVSPGVEVQLVDIDTLSRNHWEFNSKLDDVEHVFREVSLRAGLTREDSDAIPKMNAASWKKFLIELEDSPDIKKKLQADMIKNIPFAKIRVFVDGVEDLGFTRKYYFKNDRLCIPSGSCGCARAKLEIVNIYNTKHHASGEPEAINILVHQ